MGKAGRASVWSPVTRDSHPTGYNVGVEEVGNNKSLRHPFFIDHIL